MRAKALVYSRCQKKQEKNKKRSKSVRAYAPTLDVYILRNPTAYNAQIRPPE